MTVEKRKVFLGGETHGTIALIVDNDIADCASRFTLITGWSQFTLFFKLKTGVYHAANVDFLKPKGVSRKSRKKFYRSILP